MKNALILFLNIVVCTTLSCQTQTNYSVIKSEWKVGYKYSYKLTYNVESSLQTDPTEITTAFIFQSLFIIDEDDDVWKARLEFDRLDKNGANWNSGADYRFFPNTLNYDLSIYKDTSGIEVINIEAITNEYYDFLFPALGKQKALERIERIKSNNDIISMPTRDYNFIFSNSLKPVLFDKLITRDSSFEHGNSHYEESFKYDNAQKVINYSDVNVIQTSSRSDTINGYVYFTGDITMTKMNFIDYDENLIPIRSTSKQHYEQSGDQTTNISSGHVMDFGAGYFIETVLIELIDVVEIPK